MLVLGGSACYAQNAALTKIESEYHSETNVVRQAKLLAKLAPLEVDEASRQFKSDQEDAAMDVLVRLRDNARRTTDGLYATQVDASRHSAGFKELQIGLRVTLRHLNDLAFLVPSDKESQFEELRSDLASMQTSLIEALFPSAKRKHPKDEKPD